METNLSEVTKAVLSAYEYSEADLARVCDVSQTTIHRIKTGESANPGFQTASRLLELYRARPVDAA